MTITEGNQGLGFKTAKKRFTKKRPPRKNRKEGAKQTTAIILLAFSVFLLIATGAAYLNKKGRILVNNSWPFHGILFKFAHFLIALFGYAAYLLPFFIAFSGFSYLWHAKHSKRQRQIIQLAATLPIISASLTGTGKLLGWPASWGGLIGHYYYDYASNLGGAAIGWLLGTVILLLLFLTVWGQLHLAKNSVRWVIKVIRKVRKSVKSKLFPRLTSFAKKRLSQTKDKKKPPREDPGGKLFMPYPGGGGTPENRAPWDPIDDPTIPDKEAGPTPLPEPALQDPLPIAILPAPPETGLKRQKLLESIPLIQEKIIEVINRTSQIRLLKEGYEPIAGLNSIVFEFTKSAGQSLPVGAVERSLKDIGIETKRAPARLTIQDRIRIELPLTQEERSFVPIKPLLMETVSSTTDQPSLPLTYLIGRCQDGSPFQLSVEDAKHILVGGGTGGGKSVLLHAIIFGIIFRYPPSRVRLALVDHKMIEFSVYKGLPHLWSQIVTSQPGFNELVEILWAELERRKKLLTDDFNLKFPALLTIIDEFAEYDSRRLIRLIAEARALNMFFILATQHPTRENISTSIKANLVTRIAFRTKEPSGSQLLVGTSDAMALQGKGDCFVLSERVPLTRVQAAWVTAPRDGENSDIETLIDFLAANNRIPE